MVVNDYAYTLVIAVHDEVFQIHVLYFHSNFIKTYS